MREQFEGIFTAMVTPFTEGGAAVDMDKAAALAGHLADAGIHGLFTCGTTGEGLLMSVDERKALLDQLIDAEGNRLKFIAHIGALTTEATCALARHAAQAGALAVSACPPPYYNYDDASLDAHYRRVAEAVQGTPVLLYNIPQNAKNELSVDLVERLVTDVENIIGLKDSGGDIDRLQQIAKRLGPEGVLLNGADAKSVRAYSIGACGSVSGLSNIAPQCMVQILERFKAGDLDGARQAQGPIEILDNIFGYGTSLGGIKETLRQTGIDPGYVRPPQRELTETEKADLAKALAPLELGSAEAPR